MSAERYRAAGVDLDAADRTKQQIRAAVSSTRTEQSIGGFGAFAGMVRVPEGVERPALVMSTDGVGTKVLVAMRGGVHDTVGEDLVNHSVNDILVHGATPLAFQDYIAGANVGIETISALVDGVARGCRAHKMPLTGGETAQMPDVYEPGHYDLAGTIVGVVPESDVILGDLVRPGDVLIGYASSGLHTNGYTLARRVMFDELGLEVDSYVAELGASVGDALLAVHTSYWKALHPVLRQVHGLAHITGGGIPGNLGRSLPSDCAAYVHRSSWDVPPLFSVLQRAGGIDDEEMFRVFNMGIGMIAIVPTPQTASVQAAAEAAGIRTTVLGEVARGHGVHIRS